MPPEYQAFSVDNWLTIMGFMLTIGLQTFAFWRWLSGEFRKRDEARVKEIEQANDQVRRIDRDVSNLRTDLSVALAKLPTREVLDTMLQARVGPIDQEVRALTLELARNGLQIPTRTTPA